MERRLIIDEVDKKKIWFICLMLEGGQSAEKLEQSLRKFINNRPSNAEPEFPNNLKAKLFPSSSSLKRLLKDGQKGYLLEGRHPYLRQLLHLYVEENQAHLAKMQVELPVFDTTTDKKVKTKDAIADRRTGFPPDVIIALSQRAMNICSCPSCNRPTVGPVLSVPNRVHNLGIAAPIYGANPDDPRYDSSVEMDKDAIENAIWLCVFHAELISGEGSKDYPATTILSWKQAHEELIAACLEGKKRISFELKLYNGESGLAENILSYFNKQHLITSTSIPSIEESIDAVKEISAWLLIQHIYINPDSRLQLQLRAIDNVFEHFLKVIKTSERTNVFYNYFRTLQKITGDLLAETADIYKLVIPANIMKIVPVFSNINKTE